MFARLCFGRSEEARAASSSAAPPPRYKQISQERRSKSQLPAIQIRRASKMSLQSSNRKSSSSAAAPTPTTSPTSTTTADLAANKSQPEVGVSSGVNFMSRFRDKDTRVLKNLNSTQFMEVWNNYDRDGKCLRPFFFVQGLPLSEVEMAVESAG